MSNVALPRLYAPLLASLIIAMPSPSADSATLRVAIPHPAIEAPYALLAAGKVIDAGFVRFPQWDRIRRFLLDERNFHCAELRQWVAWATTLRTLPLRDRLTAINGRVQARIVYASDAVVWGRRNYWEDPREVVRKGGTDCEGFAILKMFLAIAAGIDRREMAIVVGRIPGENDYHAILLVRAEGQAYVLNNRQRRLLDLRDMPDFIPVYAVDTVSAWSYAAPAPSVEARAVGLP